MFRLLIKIILLVNVVSNGQCTIVMSYILCKLEKTTLLIVTKRLIKDEYMKATCVSQAECCPCF